MHLGLWNMSDSKYLLEIKTVQSSTFKQVIDALKDILIDVNFEFTPQGLKVVAIESARVAIVHMKLDADKFETYNYNGAERQLYVGLNMYKLHNIIKTISSSDILTLFVEKEDRNKFGIRVENPDKHIRTTYKLSMIDIDVVNLQIDDTKFECVVTMPSTDFSKIVRDMNHIGDYIEIQNVENQLCFRCNGEYCDQETVLDIDKNHNLTIVKNIEKQHEIIQGVYSLKYMNMFIKCTNLCNMVEIHLNNNFPIVLSYSVASLGSIKLLCSEKETD